MKNRLLAMILGSALAMTLFASAGIIASEEKRAEAIRMSEGQPPAKPDGEPGEMPEGQPPAKPDGELGEMPEGQPPAKPDGEPGEMPEGQPPAKPDGEPGEMPEGQPPAKPGEGGPGGMAQQVDHYDAVVTVEEDQDIEGESYQSTGKDENVIHISNGAQLTLKNVNISRTSDESSGGDTSSFYGVGAAVLTTDGTVTISDSTITTDANGGAGVFAYGNGTAYVSDSTITTEKGASGGIHVAGGGTLYADHLNVTTQGESSAAIRSDRGGGEMQVKGGNYTSNGAGSPAVYCTADIEIENANLTANGAEAVCIEGFNSLRLIDTNLTGTMPEDDRNECTWNVILYQSMSGDSEIGNSTFTMTGGTLTAKNGGMFYTTNTESTFELAAVDITYAEENDFFLKCTGNSNKRGWGRTGENGADCTFTATAQKMEGKVIWDSISNLDFRITEGSELIGSFVDDESNAGDGGTGICTVTLDKDSTWIVDGDSEVSVLHKAGKIVDSDGKSVTIIGKDGTLYEEGDSNYSITVEKYDQTIEA